jgi:hypothetical protein
MPLTTTGERGRYEFRTELVHFRMVDGSKGIHCAISYDALLRLDADLVRKPRSCGLHVFDMHRAPIEQIAGAKYDKRDDEPYGWRRVSSG